MASNYFNDNKIMNGTAIPTKGTFKVGDIIVNIGENNVDEPMWICTEAGSPGTWEVIGNTPELNLDIDDSLNKVYTTTNSVLEFESDGDEQIELVSGLEGETVRNMLPKISKNTLDWYMDYADGVTVSGEFVTVSAHTEAWYVDYSSKNPQDFKPSTNYTVFVEVITNTLATDKATTSIQFGRSGELAVFSNGLYIPINGVGMYKKVLTTKDDLSTCTYGLGIMLMGCHSGSTQFRVTLVEGDHGDKDAFFFQGIRSVGEKKGIEILNVSGELDISGITWIDGAYRRSDTGTTTTNVRMSYSDKYIAISSDERYITENVNRNIAFYKEDLTHIPWTPSKWEYVNPLGDYEDFNGGHLEVVPPTGAKFMRICAAKAVKSKVKIYSKFHKSVINKTLRGLPNGIKDTIELHDGKHYMIQRLNSYTTTPTEDIRLDTGYWNDTTIKPYLYIPLDDATTTEHNTPENIIFDTLSTANIYAATHTTEGIYKSGGRHLHFRLLKSRLTNVDMINLRAWLASNPITTVYELASNKISEIHGLDLKTFNGQNKIIVISGGFFKKDISFKVIKEFGNSINTMNKKLNDIDTALEILNKNEAKIEELTRRISQVQELKLTEKNGYINSTSKPDCNVLTATGWYYVTSPTNGPVTGGNWYLEVISRSGGYVYQRITRNINTDAPLEKYERVMYGNGVWTSWRSL